MIATLKRSSINLRPLTMPTITFDPTSTASPRFRRFEELYPYINGDYGNYNYLFGDLYTNEVPSNFQTSGLQTAFKIFTNLSNSSQSLHSYFDTAAEISAQTIWSFSTSEDYIELGGAFNLLGWNSTSQSTRYVGTHTYEGDIFNLGGGADYFNLNIYYSFNPNGWSSTRYRNFEDQVLDGGFSFTVNGGDGSDIIAASYSSSDYICNQTINNTPRSTVVIPVAVISGGSGNDEIRVQGIAGNINGDLGADIITGSGLSDSINGGAGNDIITGSIGSTYLRSPAELRQLINEKDLLTGGAGRDNFSLGYGNQYARNGSNDFGVITDFEAVDRITTIFNRGDLLMDGRDGTLSLTATSAYVARSLGYTARVYLDDDNSGTISLGDDLLLYICGTQPGTTNFVYGL